MLRSTSEISRDTPLTASQITSGTRNLPEDLRPEKRAGLLWYSPQAVLRLLKQYWPEDLDARNKLEAEVAAEKAKAPQPPAPVSHYKAEHQHALAKARAVVARRRRLEQESERFSQARASAVRARAAGNLQPDAARTLADAELTVAAARLLCEEADLAFKAEGPALKAALAADVDAARAARETHVRTQLPVVIRQMLELLSSLNTLGGFHPSTNGRPGPTFGAVCQRLTDTLAGLRPHLRNTGALKGQPISAFPLSLPSEAEWRAANEAGRAPRLALADAEGNLASFDPAAALAKILEQAEQEPAAAATPPAEAAG